MATQKQILAQTVISTSIKSTLANLMENIGNVPETLIGEVMSNGIEAPLPLIFVYSGCDDKPETVVDVKMCQPVPLDYSPKGNFTVEELPEFLCLEEAYCGNASGLEKAWGSLMENVAKLGNLPTGNGREIYLFWEEPESEKNEILLQAEL